MKAFLNKTRLLALMLTLLISVSGCAESDAEDPTDNVSSDVGIQGGAGAAQDGITAETLAYNSSDYCSEVDLDAGWDESSSTMITLSDGGIDINGSGASVKDSVVTISAAGTYVLSGTLSDGQIYVNASSNDLVRLVLNGVDLTNTTTAPIYSAQADKTVIILADGTENWVRDAESYVYAAGGDEPDAAIFSKDDLSITGSGKLSVRGNYNNGIGTKDNLCITDGNLDVIAVNDGIRGRDGVYILDGFFIIEAENDGIKANQDTDAAKGFIVIDGGEFYITSGHDGIQAETDLAITGGSFDLLTGGGASNAVQSVSDTGGWGRQQNMSAAAAESNEDTESDSMKALKAGSSLTVTGGSFSIDAEDDTVHSNGSVHIIGGSFDIATGDDGFHADNALVIDGGIISISASYEGLEGSTVDINGGEITIRSTDDGINAAGGSEAETWGPRGMDSFSGSGSYYIRITGGTVRINADGDGIDSNGALYFDGGAVYVNGPTNSANGALDAEGAIEANGGTLVAVGASGMHMAPGTGSSQPSISIYYTSVQQAGSTIILKDTDGNTVVEFTSEKDFQAAAISAEGLTVSGTYALYSGDEQLAEITLTDTVTSVSSDGSAASGGMGGFGGGGMGGGNPGGEFAKPERGTMPDGETFPSDGTMPDGGTPPGARGGGAPGADTEA